MKNYTEINAETIDRWVDEGWEWGTPVSPLHLTAEEFLSTAFECAKRLKELCI